jgi:lipopolysaccharide biosynthesis glycosyltransferase
MKEQPILHVGLAFDQNFIIHFYVVITSIFTNNKGAAITLHVITSGVSPEEQEEIRQYAQQNNAAIRYYEIDMELVSSFHIQSQYFTAATFYRLFFPAVLPPDVKRFIYLDTDIVVSGDLTRFHEIDLQGFPIAAALDPGVIARPELGVHEPYTYFNAGILLIDIDQWRQQQVTEKAVRYILDNPEKIPYVDQDALNATMIGNWRKIGNEFNLQRGNVQNVPKKQVQVLLRDAIVVHYTSNDKPWNPYCTHPLKHLYWLYLSKSPKALNKRYSGTKLFKIIATSYVNNMIVSFYLNNPVIIKTWRKLRS